jgi:hypothetical protein
LAHSRIFIVYYFRMYLALVAAGCFFGLLVLPVLLAIFGPANPVDAAPVSDAPPAAESAGLRQGGGVDVRRKFNDRGGGGGGGEEALEEAGGSESRARTDGALSVEGEARA